MGGFYVMLMSAEVGGSAGRCCSAGAPWSGHRQIARRVHPVPALVLGSSWVTCVLSVGPPLPRSERRAAQRRLGPLASWAPSSDALHPTGWRPSFDPDDRSCESAWRILLEGRILESSTPPARCWLSCPLWCTHARTPTHPLLAPRSPAPSGLRLARSSVTDGPPLHSAPAPDGQPRVGMK